DALFRSAAAAFGPRVIGVVLTGYLDDGTAGAVAIKRRGGIVIAQDPADAMASSMPESVITNVPVDYVLPITQIPAVLAELSGTSLSTSEQRETEQSMNQKSVPIDPTG